MESLVGGGIEHLTMRSMAIIAQIFAAFDYQGEKVIDTASEKLRQNLKLVLECSSACFHCITVSLRQREYCPKITSVCVSGSTSMDHPCR